MENHEIIIIGGGPAGLATAIALKQRGVKDVVVLEREDEAGGIPRHCGHGGFGYAKKYGVLSGPKLAARLRQAASGIDVRLSTSVLEFTLRGTLRVHAHSGIGEMGAEKIVIATGTRESSRAARLIGGTHVKGVMNTGELQQRIYLQHEKPFARPVILGSEWVSFSSLLTCRHAGIRPMAMITENSRIDAPSFFGWGAKLGLGVPVMTDATVVAIHGEGRVDAVEIERAGQRQMLACDGVIVSGKFRPESSLYAGGFISHVDHIPVVTNDFATSRDNVFVVGNVLGRLETAGQCMKEGMRLAERLVFS